MRCGMSELISDQFSELLLLPIPKGIPRLPDGDPSV